MASPDEPAESPALAPTSGPTSAAGAESTVDSPPGQPQSAGAGARRRPPLALAVAVAVGWAALVTFVPVGAVVMLLTAVEAGLADGAGPVRVALAGWLLAHGVTIDTADGPIGLAPLAVTVVAVWRTARAGVHVTRAIGAAGSRSLARALKVAAAVAVGYGAVGALAGYAVSAEPWGPPIPLAAAVLAGFGLVAGGYGGLRATGVLARWAHRLPVAVPAGVRAGVVAAVLVVAAGAVLAGVAVAANGSAAADSFSAYGAGVAGQAGLALLCLVYAPNLAVWAAAYALGPGFTVGGDTVLRSSEVVVGPLPELPVFAGLPYAPLPTLGAVLLLVPVAAGAVAAAGLGRGGVGRYGLLGAVVVAGLVAGGLLGLAAFAAGGPLGAGQLSMLGPPPLPVAAVSAGSVSAGAVLGAGAAAVLARLRPPADPRS